MTSIETNPMPARAVSIRLRAAEIVAGAPALARRAARYVRSGQDLDRLVAGGLKLGSDVSVQDGVVFDGAFPWLIEIGAETTIAPQAYLLAHDASTRRPLGRTRVGRVVVGRRVFIGARALIMPGVTIGDGVSFTPAPFSAVKTCPSISNSTTMTEPASLPCTSRPALP